MAEPVKRDIEMTVNFDGQEFDNLRSVWFDRSYIRLDLWVSESKHETKSLGWEEWDALVAEVEQYRKLKAISEQAA